MKKLWFYFNTMQLVDTFTEFHSVKAPANVQMISDALLNAREHILRLQRQGLGKI